MKGRKATLTVGGARQLAAVFTTGPDRGIARVCVNGSDCRTIDLYRRTRAPRRILRTWAFAGAADRTVTVTVTGTKRSASTGRTVELDAVVAITD